MRRATFLASVRADLTGILAYIADPSGSVAIADTFVSRLRAQCHKLAALEGTIGRARPELRPDIRSCPYKGYVIFFRYVGDRFEVVNILESIGTPIPTSIKAWAAKTRNPAMIPRFVAASQHAPLRSSPPDDTVTAACRRPAPSEPPPCDNLDPIPPIGHSHPLSGGRNVR